MRVLPSTSGSSIWVVVPDGCTENDGTNCGENRGRLFDFSASSTLVEKGIYNLPLETEKQWGYSGNGQFAFDEITLSYNGGGAPTLNNTIFAGIATKNFFIGQMGLTPWGVNFTDFNSPIPSLLTTLKEQGHIDSNSWGYTAGAYYSQPQTYGSLTFGGYDESRYTPNDLIFNRGEDQSRDLTVGVQSITSGTNNLLPNGIFALIDSTIAQLWLPLEACTRFEEVFGLVWDESVELYLVNDTLHQNLLADNPSITFALGSTTTSADTINIKFPYAAFDQTASAPLTSGGNSKYFPLRRADNTSQYLLGRTFLQEAYVTVDYGRNTFQVAQALFPGPNEPQKLVAVSSPGGDSSSPSIGLIVGIVVAVVVILAIAGAAFWWWRRKRRANRALAFADKQSQGGYQPVDNGKPELDAGDPAIPHYFSNPASPGTPGTYYDSQSGTYFSLDNKGTLTPLAGKPHEADSIQKLPPELYSMYGTRPEMHGINRYAVEMEDLRRRHEAPGGEARRYEAPGSEPQRYELA